MNLPYYFLRCRGCGKAFEDDGFILDCSVQHEPALLVVDYGNKRFEPDDSIEGMFRYRRWLPSRRILAGAGSSATYKSEKLNHILGLRNMWVVFNGYWPERGATLETTTFKELEAWSILSRIPEQHEGVLVVASAGNTAAAFARACSINGVPCLIVVPETGIPALRFSEPIDPCVRIVSLTGFTDYYDAITLANRIAQIEGFFPEGGVRNVAKREGLGTPVLNAVETIGQLPDYYFQAIGSGAGGIAAHQAAIRLVDDGRFGDRLPKLLLSQNLPFVPIYMSWKSGRRELVEIGHDDGKKLIKQTVAHVLSNQRPPYSSNGGVFDVLTESQGDMLTADNLEALHAKRLFEDTEGIDIDPAAAVAFATLIKAARYGELEKEALVLLNITGGGRLRQQRDKKLIDVRPSVEITEEEHHRADTIDRIVGMFY